MRLPLASFSRIPLVLVLFALAGTCAVSARAEARLELAAPPTGLGYNFFYNQFSDDSTLMVTVPGYSGIHRTFWDLGSGQLVAGDPADPRKPRALDLTENRQLLLQYDFGKQLFLAPASGAGPAIPLEAPAGNVVDARFVADGEIALAAFASEGGVAFAGYSAETGERLWERDVDNGVAATVAIYPDAGGAIILIREPDPFNQSTAYEGWIVIDGATGETRAEATGQFSDYGSNTYQEYSSRHALVGGFFETNSTLIDLATGETVELADSGFHSIRYVARGSILAMPRWPTTRVIDTSDGHDYGDAQALVADLTANSYDAASRLEASAELRLLFIPVDDTIRVFDLDTFEPKYSIGPVTARVGRLAISPDGETLAVTLNDGAVHLYAAETGALLAEAEPGHYLSSIAYTPDGSGLMVDAFASRPMFLDATTLEPREAQLPGSAGATVYDPTTDRFLSILNDGRVHYRRVSDFEIVESKPHAPRTDLIFGISIPAGAYLQGRTIRSIETGETDWTAGETITHIRDGWMTDAGDRVVLHAAISGMGKLRAFERNDPDAALLLDESLPGGALGGFAPDGSAFAWIAAGTDSKAPISHARIYRFGEAEPLIEVPGLSGARWLAFANDSETLRVVSSNPARALATIDAATGAILREYALPIAGAIGYGFDPSIDGYFALVGEDGIMRLLNLNTGLVETEARLEWPGSRRFDSIHFDGVPIIASGGAILHSHSSVMTLFRLDLLRLAHSRIVRDGAGFAIEFESEPGKSYTLETSDDLATWTPSAAVENAEAPLSALPFPMPAATPRFGRVLETAE